MNYIDKLLEEAENRKKEIEIVKEYTESNFQPKDGEFFWNLEFEIESLNKEIHELKLLKAQGQIIIDGLKGDKKHVKYKEN